MKRYVIASDNPNRISVTEESVIDVMPGKSSYIRLEFHLSDNTGLDENDVYVTLTDVQEARCEECLLFKLTYI